MTTFVCASAPDRKSAARARIRGRLMGLPPVVVRRTYRLVRDATTRPPLCPDNVPAHRLRCGVTARAGRATRIAAPPHFLAAFAAAGGLAASAAQALPQELVGQRLHERRLRVGRGAAV